jgi:hypothetical protein
MAARFALAYLEYCDQLKRTFACNIVNNFRAGRFLIVLQALNNGKELSWKFYFIIWGLIAERFIKGCYQTISLNVLLYLISILFHIFSHFNIISSVFQTLRRDSIYCDVEKRRFGNKSEFKETFDCR